MKQAKILQRWKHEKAKKTKVPASSILREQLQGRLMDIDRLLSELQSLEYCKAQSTDYLISDPTAS